MSGFAKRNINGILGTILFHLVIIVVAMAFQLKQPKPSNEEFMIIDPEFLEEYIQDQKPDDATQAELDEIEIEKYINEIRNVGANSRVNTQYAEIETMSQEEMKKMYEAEMLKEKYGADYEKMINSTYEDYIKDNPETNKQIDKQNNNSSSSSTYSGPALVYVELSNPDRGKSYIHVPVFTCKDGGNVVINITINSDGTVKSATVVSAKSKGDATCISNSARDAALKSKFTPIAGGANETGKITYSFMQQ